MADNVDQQHPRDANDLVDKSEDHMVDRPDDTDVGPAYRIPEPVAAMARIKHAFESEMSKFIEGAMLAEYGETWFSARVINRSSRNVQNYLNKLFDDGKGKRPVDILDIGNYADVVVRNPDAFRSTLNSPQDVAQLRQIRDMRIRYVAHPGDPYSATVQRFANLCIAVMRKSELTDAAHEIQLILEEASSLSAANVRMMPTGDIAVEETARDADASSDASLRVGPPASGDVHGDTDDRGYMPSNAEMDASRSRSSETQSEAEGSEQESDPAPPLGGSKPDPERLQRRPDESPRLEAAVAAEQPGHEQRALADTDEARRIASSTQDGPSGGGGGPGAATLAGAGDEDRSPLGGGWQRQRMRRWLRQHPLLAALAALAIAAIIIAVGVATRLDGSPPAVAPAIDGNINCKPTSPMIGEAMSCHADLSGGEPDSWFWSVNGTPTSQSWSRGDRPYDDPPSFKTTFSSRGSYELTLTVANDADDVSKSFNIKVLPPRPTIKRLACSPENPAVYEPTVREPIICTAPLGGGAPDSWSWSGGDDPSSGDKAEFTTVFSSPGSRAITVTVENETDSDSRRLEIEVLPLPPTIGKPKCSPPTPKVGDRIRCTAPLGGGEPDSWTWSGGGDPPSGDKAEFTTVFSSPGSREITLTVENNGGRDSKSHNIDMLPLAPTIKSEELKCLPATPTVGQTVECSAPLGGGDPDSWRWSGGGEPDSRSWNRDDPPYGDQPTFETTFSSPRSHELTLAVENTGGDDSAVVAVQVREPPPPPPPPRPPVIDEISCEPASPMVGETVSCSAELGGDEPDSWLWSLNGNPTSQSWKRGDPPYGDQPTFETTFSSPRSHELTLTVENDAYRVSASHNIEVCAQPAGDEMDPPGFDDDDMMGSERFECDGVARQGSEGGSSEDDMMGQGGFDNSGE